MHNNTFIIRNFRADNAVVNLGGTVGDQIINTSEQNVEVILADFKQFLNDLQQKYPNATDETAIQVIDAEFTFLHQQPNVQRASRSSHPGQ
jgi:hypothetical protein